MERLSHLIAEAVHQGKWKLVRASRNGPRIFHLMFANDLILFAEASEEQAMVIRKVLENFCAISGQKVNMAKSKIFCLGNTPRELARRISKMTKVSLTTNLGK